MILKSGPHGCSVVAAPPTCVAALEHRDAAPRRASSPAATSPLCPPPTTTTSNAVAHRATRLREATRQVVERGTVAPSGSFARSSARRSSRIASRSGSAVEPATVGVVERVALRRERLDAARAEPSAVRRIGGDEVALRDHVRARRAGRPADRAAARRARRPAAVVVAVVVGVRDVGDVVHEPGDRQLGVVRVLGPEDRAALEGMGEAVEVGLVVHARGRWPGARAARRRSSPPRYPDPVHVP